jgi:hypothetical protein
MELNEMPKRALFLVGLGFLAMLASAGNGGCSSGELPYGSSGNNGGSGGVGGAGEQCALYYWNTCNILVTCECNDGFSLSWGCCNPWGDCATACVHHGGADGGCK